MPFEIPQKTEQQDRVQMGRIALDAIAAHILTVPKDLFRMGLYQCEMACGTVGCAIGHSYDLPAVVATGLRCSHSGYPIFKGHMGQEATASALGITVDDALDLFGSWRDGESSEVVSRRIREYLAA